MKKTLLSMLVIALMASPVLASNDGGKKKAKKQARIEARKAKAEAKVLAEACDPNCCDYRDCCPKTDCAEAAVCSGK